MTRLIDIDGLVFNGEPGPADRLIWVGLDGWFGSPPVRADVEDRPNADGAEDVDKHFRSARVLRFTGALIGSDPFSAQDELMDAFAAVQADGVPFPLTVTTDVGPRTVTGTLQGEASVTPDFSMQRATVVATIVCFDPVKYGPAVVQSTGLPSAGGGLEYPLGDPAGALYYGAVGASGRVTVVNTGRAATWPFFRVSGQLDGGFEIRCVDTGDTLRYERVVPAGTSVTIDSRTGAVLIDDVSDASTYLTRDGFFSVPPMGSCEIQFSALSTSSGTPTLEVTSWSGWW